MTQLHFTLNIKDIQNLINAEVKNDMAKTIPTKVFNELMEKERDEYLENEAYQRGPNRTTYRNGYYERDYTTKIGALTLRVPRTRDGKFSKYENEKKFQNSLKTLDEGFEDAFAYLANDVVHSRLRTTNCLERLNQEVRRREKVIRIFPNEIRPSD